MVFKCTLKSDRDLFGFETIEYRRLAKIKGTMATMSRIAISRKEAIIAIISTSASTAASLDLC